MNRYSPLAAAAIIVAALIVFSTPSATHQAQAANVVMVPDGGRLDAVDALGAVVGPCPLKHTDVNVDVSGWFARVTLRQDFHNPYTDKIEAVYTFPLSHRAAVDRMTMTIGDRVIEGEVHERERARAIYEAAKQSGHVASLLEQERPNIFTQSVANIEPGADVLIEISYVELLESKEGVFSFNFPMVVGPRYIPGSPTGDGPAGESFGSATQALPAGLKARFGLVLLAPADLTVGQASKVDELGALDKDRLRRLLEAATPIAQPDDAWWAQAGDKAAVQAWHQFQAAYPTGTTEQGVLYTNGIGQLGGRWFYFDAAAAVPTGAAYSPNTDQVPDASRITPMPTKPPMRAGHDISVSVAIDTGGPGIADLKSALHEINVGEQLVRPDGLPHTVKLQLAAANEIPNRDFILTWREVADTITESFFTHTGDLGNFFTLILQPPERVTDAQAVPRELIFVLDSSGSMSGLPIDKAKECMATAMNGLRPQDTFNLITFSGDTSILWDQPRSGTWENIAAAQNFLASRQGSGGTEMMTAINAALVKTRTGPLSPRQLANLPADGRTVQVLVPAGQITSEFRQDLLRTVWTIAVREGLSLSVENLGQVFPRDGEQVLIDGTWQTVDGERALVATSAMATRPPPEPIRIVCFMTDGYVGNDMAIIDAVRNNAHTTRVFSFGIGNSVNRYLLDGIASAGRGAVDYVPLTEQADAVAERFLKRIQTPVLTDIELAFSDGLRVADVLPQQVPDLWDQAPIIIHGRYTAPGTGTLTIRGNAGDGPYEGVLDLEFPEQQAEHDTIATLWARTKVEQIMNRDLAAAQAGRFPDELRRQVIDLGEQFGIMTQFTSFVAVEKLRVTLGGQARLVNVPIELPEGVSYEGNFGERLCKWGQGIAQMKSAPRTAQQLASGAPTAQASTQAGISARVVPLKNVSATAVNEQLSKMLMKAAASGGLAGVKMDPASVVADERTNSLVVTGSPEDFAVVADIIDQLDSQAIPDRENFVITLGNKKVEDMQAALQSYFQAEEQRLVAEEYREIEHREMARLELIQETKQKQVDQLMQQASQLRKDQRLDDAVQVLKQVQVIDPRNNEAALQKEILEDLSGHRRDRQAVIDGDKEGQDFFVESGEAGIPWHQGMIYPKNWPEIPGEQVGQNQANGGIGGGRFLRGSVGGGQDPVGGGASTDDNQRRVIRLDNLTSDKAKQLINELQRSHEGEAGGGGGQNPFGQGGQPDRVHHLAVQLNMSPSQIKGLAEQIRQQGQAPSAQAGPGQAPLGGEIYDPQQLYGFSVPASPSAVDLWSIVRANNSTPKQLICPSTSDYPDATADTTSLYDFENDTSPGLSYSYQYQHDANGLTDFAIGAQAAAPASDADRESEFLVYGRRKGDEAGGVMGPPAPAGVGPESQAPPAISRAAFARLQLRQPIASMAFVGTPLDEALRFLGAWSHVKVVANWPVLRRLNVEPTAPVSVKCEEATIGEVLDSVLAQFEQAGLGYALTADGAVLVTTQQELAYRRMMTIARVLGCDVDPSAMLAEQVAVQAARVYADGDALAADVLVSALTAWAPDFKTGTDLYAALTTMPLSEDGRTQAVAEVRDQAAAAIDEFAARMQTIARRLDERLLALVMGGETESKTGKLSFEDGKVVVKVLTAGRTAALDATIKAAGLEVSTAAKSTEVLVGTIAPEKLTALALIDGVRRIEPVEQKTARR